MLERAEKEPAERIGAPDPSATCAELRLLVVDDYETGSHLEIPYVPDEEVLEPVGAGPAMRRKA